jgi:hypothetical protein
MEEKLKKMLDEVELNTNLEVMVKDQDDEAGGQCKSKGPDCQEHSIG